MEEEKKPSEKVLGEGDIIFGKPILAVKKDCPDIERYLARVRRGYEYAKNNPMRLGCSL